MNIYAEQLKVSEIKTKQYLISLLKLIVPMGSESLVDVFTPVLLPINIKKF